MEQDQQNKSSDTDIFRRLVLDTDENSPERFIGMLAYVEWKLETLKHPQVSGNFWTELHLTAFRGRGADTLNAYALVIAERELKKLLQDAEISEELKLVETRLARSISRDLKAVESHLNSQIETNSKTSFWRPVWQSYIASWVFVVTFPIIAVLVWSAFDNGKWFKNCLETLPKPSQVQQNTNQE